MDDHGPALRREMSTHLLDLLKFARSLTRDASQADDLAQTTLMRAIGALDRFRPGTNMKAWLFTIARNQFLYDRRQRRSEQLHLERMPVPVGDGTRQASRDELADLQRLLATLSPSLQEALLLVGARGLSHDEASVRCGVSAVTIRGRVFRARSLLARQADDALRSAHPGADD